MALVSKHEDIVWVSFMIPFCSCVILLLCCLLPNSTHKAQTLVNTHCEVFSSVFLFCFGAGFNMSWNGYSVHDVIIVNENVFKKKQKQMSSVDGPVLLTSELDVKSL